MFGTILTLDIHNELTFEERQRGNLLAARHGQAYSPKKRVKALNTLNRKGQSGNL